MVKYTAAAAATGATLVVFPETFLPYRLTEGNTLGTYVRYLATTYQVTIRCGGFHYEDGQYYNGVFTVLAFSYYDTPTNVWVI